MTSKVTYEGGLRTRCIHLNSGNGFITDAPLDNNGKGEAFSPTDTVATALASCMFTIMGIRARGLEVNLEGATAKVTKIMAAEPRRISKIIIDFDFLHPVNEKNRHILENAARTCPVIFSLHPDIEKQVTFNWK